MAIAARDTKMNDPNRFAPLVDSLESGLSSIFGFESFRIGQRDVMEATLQGVNSLVVMPTGSGKSLCFQLPACASDGITLVISPLIALMKDQVDALTSKGIPATFINSSIGAREQSDRLFGMEAGAYKIVYVAPERFRSERFCDAIANVKIAFLAIDEAHCISQWGHDFRPDYLRLAEIRAQLGHPTTIALTATATSQVQRDILAQLNLPEAEIFVYGFERPNLFFEVYDARSKGDKIGRIVSLVNEHSGDPAIIYCATRKQVEEVAQELDSEGLSVGLYHGGMTDSQREQVQNDFMTGMFTLLVATNAFGMGVDKSDVRVIAHYNIPGSIEAYYQEAGRAGRDGLDSHCLMLFNYADKGIHDFFNEQTYPSKETVERIWEVLSKMGLGTHNIGSRQLADKLNRNKRGKGRLNSWGVESAMRQLQRGGHIDFGTRDGFDWIAVQDFARTRDLRVDWDYLKRRRDVNDDLLGDVMRLASGRECRQGYLLRYFNSAPSFTNGCGNCDICCGMPEYAKAALVENTQPIRVPEDPTTVIQKALAGVARSRGRFGAHIVAGALRGSKAKKVVASKLDRLSTYGILSYLKQPDIVSMLDTFLRQNLLTRNDFGALSLTELGNEVMRDPEQMPEDLKLWADVTLIPRGRRRAQSSRKTARPPAAQTVAAIASARAELEDAPAGLDGTYVDTLAMLRQGQSPAEIASVRGVQTQTILRHLMVIADHGEPVDLSAYIDPTLLEGVRDAADGWSYGEALGPIKRKAPKCTYDDLKLHLAQVLIDRKSS